MKVAVLSDSHDNTQNLRQALKRARDSGCEAIIFLGDFCAPPAFRIVAEEKLPTYFVFGNVDGEQSIISREAAVMQHVTFDRDFLEFELSGKRIAICHRPEFAEGLAATGKYDVVFHGHTHTPRNEMIGKTLLANPGEILGSVSGASFGIYDTASGCFEVVRLS